MRTTELKRKRSAAAKARVVNVPEDVLRLAEKTERQLNQIQRRVRQRLNEEYAKGELTGPQKLVMRELAAKEGLSLSDLSERVALAHSTVSGIVDRLEAKGLLERRPHPEDGRVTVLVASRAVRQWLEVRRPALALDPLAEALKGASPCEARLVTRGLETLLRLLRGLEKEKRGEE